MLKILVKSSANIKAGLFPNDLMNSRSSYGTHNGPRVYFECVGDDLVITIDKDYQILENKEKKD